MQITYDLPVGVTLDAQGNLYDSDQDNNWITEFAPPYTGDAIQQIRSNMAMPAGLAYRAAYTVTIGS